MSQNLQMLASFTFYMLQAGTHARWHLHAAQGAPVACAAGHNEMLGPALMAVEAAVVRVYCPAAFDGAVGTCAHIEVTPESS